MSKMSRGPRSRSRKKMTKRARDRGKVPITKYLQNFEIGEKAAMVIEPTAYKGGPHHKFHGLTGTITGKQGNAYKLKVKDGNMEKIILAKPEHLKKVGV